jgi:hypothetical protein
MAHVLLLFIVGCDDVHPKTNPNPIRKRTNMNKDVTTKSPEFISDEQLEEAAGGLADVENNTCATTDQATAQINL